MRTTFAVGRVSAQRTQITVSADRTRIPVRVVRRQDGHRTLPRAVVPAFQAVAVH